MIIRTVLVLSAAAALALAAEDTDKKAAPEGGVVVFKDPATGKIRQPEASEIGTLVNQPAASAQRKAIPATASAPFTTKSGAVGVKLGADSMSYVVVTKSADGKMTQACVTGDKAATELVSSGVRGGADEK